MTWFTPIDSVLEAGDEIIWKGFVNRTALVLKSIIIFIVFLIIGYFFFTQGILNVKNTDTGQISKVSGSLAGSIMIIVGIVSAFLGYFIDLVKEYALTKKRVIIKAGIIGTDFKSIYYDQIKNVEVQVGLIGKLLSVGTVKIDTGKTETYSSSSSLNKGGGTVVSTRTMYENLKYIDKPYEVYQNLQSILNQRKENLYSGKTN